MAFRYADRVRETSTSTGTGTFSLAGAVSGFQTFLSGIGASNTCYYAISHRTASEWEVGYGTLDLVGTTLTRTTVLASSNLGSAVTFSAGTKDVFVVIPATALASISTPNATGSALQALVLSPYGATAGNTAEMRFLELAANGTNYVGFKAADSLSANVVWTLPSADGSANTFLQTNGSGVTTWATVTTVGTVTSGTWNAGTIGILYGGTGQTTASAAYNALTPITTLGDLVYGSGTNTATRLAGNTTTTKQFLSQTGTGTISAIPSWSTVSKSDVGLGSVENTALSTWAGSTNITTLGTIATGTWSATTIGTTKGGTGLTAIGTANQVLGVNSGATALEYKTLTAGSNVSITHGVGTVTIAATGTVTSVGLSLPAIFTVTNSPVTSSGTLTGTLATQTANLVFAGPTTGVAATPTFRSLVAADLPTITSLGTVTTGTWNASIIGLAYGGTNANITAVNGAVAYSTASALALTAAGTANQVLVSNGAAAPTWASGLTLNAQQAVLINPYGVSAGNTSELRFGELAANGTNYVGFKAPDNIAANKTWTLPSADGVSGQLLSTNGSATLSWISAQVMMAGGRLTISTGIPYQGAIATFNTLYYTPYSSAVVYLWTGSAWVPYTLTSDLSITNAGTVANQNYDVSISWNSGSPQLVLTVWATHTAAGSTRATAITYQDQIPMIGSNRYIGTVRMDGSNLFADWFEQRYIWNAFNRVRKLLSRDAGFATWTYATGSVFRYARNDTANKVSWISGIEGAAYIDLWLHVGATSTGTVNAYGGIGMSGLNATPPAYGGMRQGFCYVTNTQNYMVANFFGGLEEGYNFGAWYEALTASVSTTFYGTNRAGVSGTIEC